MDDYSGYGKKVEKIRKINRKYLQGFGEYLEAQGLKDRTIDTHLNNVNFYINTFLVHDDALDVKQGCYQVDQFLGNWFIRKAMWSNVASIRSNISSFKKFYSYLLGTKVIDKDDYDELCETIRYGKEDWFDLVNRYNDPAEENPFSPF